MSTLPNHAMDEGSCFGGVAIVGSAGGIPALIELLGSLKATFPLPIFVAQHLPRTESALDRLLSRHCQLPVQWASSGVCGQLKGVYLASPGTGLRLTSSGIEIDMLPLPSTSWLTTGDSMFRSVFSVFEARTMAIVLSGMLPAGVEGLRTVRAGGGITMAQNRKSCTDFEMPSAAIDLGKAELVCPPWRMAQIMTLVAEDWKQAGPVPVHQNTPAVSGWRSL